MKSKKDLSTLNKYPKGYYACEKCNDTGVISVESNGEHLGVKACFCQLRRSKVRAFGELYENKTLENYEGRNPSMRLAKGFIERNLDKSFFIFGGVGLGKTHLLAGIYDRLYGFNKWQSAIVLKESSLLEAVKHDGLTDRIREYTTFFLDDMGKVKIAPWEAQALFYFFDNLYRFEKQVFISSNYSLESIKEYYGGAITRRITERSEIIEIKGAE